MFERFTDRARRIVVLAQEEARLLSHSYIGTEHLLLGLVREGEGVAAKALGNLGVSLDAVRNEVEAIVGVGGSSPSGHIPFTPRAKKVLELSLREALQLGHNYTGTEHILLGLIREGEGVAARVLARLGADLPRVRQEVINLLSGYPGVPSLGVAPRAEGPYTPGTLRAANRARGLAGDRPVGTHHTVRAIVDDERSLGARALAALGVTPESLAAKLAELETAGTSDELPDEAGARRTSVEIRDGRVAVIIDDDELAAWLVEAAPEREPFVVRSDDPAAASFPRLWQDVTRHLSDVMARLGQAAVARWRPPEWNQPWSVAAYAVYNHPAGIQSAFEVAAGADERSVRSELAAWLTSHQSARDPQATYLVVLVDTDESGARTFTLHTGNHPAGAVTAVHFLMAHAILDLTEPPAATAS